MKPQRNERINWKRCATRMSRTTLRVIISKTNEIRDKKESISSKVKAETLEVKQTRMKTIRNQQDLKLKSEKTRSKTKRLKTTRNKKFQN